jgi:Uma2 family endonuclease
MSIATPVLKPVSQLQLAPGSRVLIDNVTWQEFEVILEELGDRRSARIAYHDRMLEIMVPLPEHEKPNDVIADVVKQLLKATGQRCEPFGSTTFKLAGTAGVEPDASFYIQNYQRMIGRRRLQPDDPPPDLAIETDVTSKTTMDAYQALRVPEVWVYADRQLTIYLWQPQGYVTSPVSPLFPDIPISQLVAQTVERSWQVGYDAALDELHQWIVSHLAP